ncbi:ExbD/TolR family protein [Acidihalobacter prosperus]|uniref:Biopolymer transporter ExbD n=1 Tax=Acidihalobacter prosperus TaxID=160660 RepID=A0A1A6C2L0_9GAMM|nr:biopolymer transporter ExbD [Acidihalobacter prosperus]OBS08667.1 biopolymer transporter ExbD [Acidihalobacter prosperus]OBS08793.1 biopolymer transporter ExbD [Acidihalobacter prosperus]
MDRSRYFEHQEPRLNIIPMIDIMMFLLVFFVLMVLHMIPNTGVKLHLPSASTATKLPHKSVIVGVTDKGAVRYQDHTVTLDALKQALSALKDKATVSVIIASDGKATVKELTGVMNAVRELGISKIGLATRAGSPAGAGKTAPAAAPPTGSAAP